MADRFRTFILPGLFLLLATLMLYLPGTRTLPLMDRDEPRFAQATVEMMQRGTWTVPYFNEEYRFDKPPLTYWWMRLHYLLGGVSELTARLHSVVAVWLTAWLVAGIGARLYDRRTGFLAGLIWLTTLQVLVHGRLCVADMALLLFLTLMARALLELLWLGESRRWSPWFWLLYVGLGLGFLAKGPLALLVPAVAVGLSRWWGKKPLPWKNLQLGPGLAIALGIVAIWGVPALIETQGLFWKVGMGEHVVKRGTEVLNGRFFIPGIYFVTALISLFPWIGLAWPVWKYARKQWDSGVVFLLGWLAAPYLIFTFYATQLPHYVMPGFPAAAILVARWLVARQKYGERTPIFMKILAGVLGCLGLGLVIYTQVKPTGEVQGLIVWCGLLLIVLGVAGRYAQRMTMLERPVLGLVVMVLSFGMAVEQLAWTVRKTNATLKIVKSVPTLSKDMACLGWDYTEPSLVFYTQRSWEFTGKAAQVDTFLQEHPHALVVALTREWTLDGWIKKQFSGQSTEEPTRDQIAKVTALIKRTPGLEAHVITGLNAARMSWVEVMVLERPPTTSQVSLN